MKKQISALAAWGMALCMLAASVLPVQAAQTDSEPVPPVLTTDEPRLRGSRPEDNELFDDDNEYVLYEDGTVGFACTDDSITSITVPDSFEGMPVTRLENYCFSGCTNLTEIHLPDTITSIGANAFQDTPWLEQQLEWSNEVIVNHILVAAKPQPTGRYLVSDGVTAIAGDAMSYCTELERLRIPGSVKVIGHSAFNGCTNLREIILDEGIEEIGQFAFNGCTALDTATLPDTLQGVGLDAFDGTPLLDAKLAENSLWIEGDMLIKAAPALTGTVTVPEGIRYIGDEAFYTENSALSAVMLPDTVEEIGDCAFLYCKNLESVTLSDSLKRIGDRAFDGCSSLRSIDLPGALVTIGSSAFSGCAGLEAVTIPDRCTKIGGYAFFNCTKLAAVDLPSTTEIGDHVFTETPWLEQKKAENPIVIINGVVSDLSGASGEVVIPDGVSRIASDAANGNQHITAVSFPQTLEEIGGAAFMDCANLKHITLPEGLEMIGHYAFGGTGIESVTLPSSLKYTGEFLFHTISDRPTTSLKTVTFLNPDMHMFKNSFVVYHEARDGTEDFTVSVEETPVFIGYPGSTAEAFAAQYGIRFQSIGAAENPYIHAAFGDLDANNTTDTNDAYLVLNYFSLVASGQTDAAFPTQYADLDKSGTVDTEDAYQMLDYFAYKGAGGTMKLDEWLTA